MNKALAIFKWPVVVSTAATLPFVILELINQPESYSNFPFALFIVLWLILMAFCLVLFPMLRNSYREFNWRSLPGLVGRLTLLVFLGIMWIRAMVDQMPCFLGVPNCD